MPIPSRRLTVHPRPLAFGAALLVAPLLVAVLPVPAEALPATPADAAAPAPEAPFDPSKIRYAVVPVEVPGADVYAVQAAALNNRGQVAGSFTRTYVADAQQRQTIDPFVWDRDRGATRLPEPAGCASVPDDVTTFAVEINDAGRVVGTSKVYDGQPFGQCGSHVSSRAVAWDGGSLTASSPPPATYPPVYSSSTTAAGVNARGVVVGAFAQSCADYTVVASPGPRRDCPANPFSNDVDQSNFEVAARFRGPGAEPEPDARVLPPPDAVDYYGPATTAVAVNDAGDLVGYTSYVYPSLATVWPQGGAMVSLGQVVDGRNRAGQQGLDINNAGHVSNLSEYPNSVPALWDGTRTAKLPLPAGATSGFAAALNDRDKVVGHATWSTGESRAMLWDAVTGTALDLNSVTLHGGGVLTEAVDINVNGQILAAYRAPGDPSVTQYVVLDPTDTDRDALYDYWETHGIDADLDGKSDLDLNTSPLHKDLFVEVDAMKDRGPTEADLQRVVRAFDDAPVDNPDPDPNPDQARGIRLHINYDERAIKRVDFPGTKEGLKAWPDFEAFKRERFGSVTDRADIDWLTSPRRRAREVVYHYAVFGNRFGGSESADARGIGEIGGNDLIVAFDETWQLRFTSDSFVAPRRSDFLMGAFMHELGHNLGLRHGGADSINFKPNYVSVMNYLWAYPRKKLEDLGEGSWRLDFSRQQLRPLDERDLNEADGIGGRPLVRTLAYLKGTSEAKLVPESGPIDWNNDKKIDLAVVTHVTANVNGDTVTVDGKTKPRYDVLRGQDDWAKVSLLRGPRWRTPEP